MILHEIRDQKKIVVLAYESMRGYAVATSLHAGASFPVTCSLSFDSKKKKRRFVGWPVRYIKSIFFAERPKKSRDGTLTNRSARGRR